MYGVSKEEYTACIKAGTIPILHVGKYENLRYLRESGLHSGIGLLLWTDRAVVQSRLTERHKYRVDGIEERLVAYDEELAQLKSHLALGELDIDLVFANNASDPSTAVDALLSLLRSHPLRSSKEANEELSRLLGL
jgi:guanylate kinase